MKWREGAWGGAGRQGQGPGARAAGRARFHAVPRHAKPWTHTAAPLRALGCCGCCAALEPAPTSAALRLRPPPHLGLLLGVLLRVQVHRVERVGHRHRLGRRRTPPAIQRRQLSRLPRRQIGLQLGGLVLALLAQPLDLVFEGLLLLKRRSGWGGGGGAKRDRARLINTTAGG
jgi:hypothetical protein